MPLKREHQELRANLVKATKVGGRVGDAAQGGCREFFTSTSWERSQVALPSLGLLSTLAWHRVEEVLKID